MMAVYQRCRHSGETGEYWPDKPEAAPAVSHYPNILAELDASGFWIDRIARFAQVSMELMAAAMEDGGKLSFQELRGLTRCFGCKMDYLYSPILSMVDPSTNKGKARLWHLRDLVRRTEGLDRSLYHIYSEKILPALESGKPVTYAAYHWACYRLQDVLDRKAREETRQQHIRTGETLPVQSQKDVGTSLAARLRLVRERNKSRELEHRLSEMCRYVDHVRVQEGEDYQVTSKEMLALAEFSHRDLFGAVLLAFTYGRAKGCQAAKGACRNDLGYTCSAGDSPSATI